MVIACLSKIVRLPLCLPSRCIDVSFPLPLLFWLDKNIMSSVGNRLLWQNDWSVSLLFLLLPHALLLFYYIYPEIKRHKEEKYFIVVTATYSKIMFVSTFSAIVYNLDLSLDAVLLCIS